MVSVVEYWKEISTTVGGIVVFLFGRKSAKILERKQNSEAIEILQKTYDTFLKHHSLQYENIVKRFDEQTIIIDEQKKEIKKLQGQFIELNLAYSREVEISQNWEKLHRELEQKYRDLENKYRELEKRYDISEKNYKNLKADFDKHKKQGL